jgi:iron complex transport system substrate-binding protein
MLRSRIKLGLFGILLVLWSCSAPQRPPKSGQNNLCQHSEYLRIYRIHNGFKIEILDPDAHCKQQVFQIYKPYRRIAGLSATHVGMLCAIKEQGRLSAVSSTKYVYDPKVKALIQAGKIDDLRTEQGFSADKFLKNGTQIVVYSGFGNENKQLQRLKGSTIEQMPNYEWREKSPLARAEWVLLFGVLSGEFAKAQAFFNAVEHNYTALQKSIQQNNKSNQLPVLISGNLYGDQWIAPAGQSFEAQLYNDAGMAYLFAKEKGTGSVFKSLPEILKRGPIVNLWLNPGQPTRGAILRQYAKARYFPFYRKAIYCYTSQTNKYWEQTAAHPDWLLSDLAQIASGKPKKLHFYALVK